MENSENKNRTSVAVIGSGYWGKNLIRNFNNFNSLKLICDKNEILLAQFKKKYPEVETCLALKDVIAHQDIQAAVIATPAEIHYTLAREVLLAGKHVFVEKPLVLYENQAEELIALAKEKDRIIMVGHLLQYHPAFVKLKELAAKGDLGRINYIYSNRLNLGKIRREENILWSFAPHDISMILSLAGEEPESVSSTGGNYLHKEIADVTTTHLEFPSGLQAHIFVSWLHPFKEQKLVVVGDRKMAVFDDTKPREEKLLLYPHAIKWQNSIPVPARAEPERIDIPDDEPLMLECAHFLDCIKNNKQPKTDGREGLSVLRILNAAQKSLDEQSRRIVIGEDSEVRSQETPAPLPIPPYPLPAFQNCFVHETALIDKGCEIGPGTKIWHFSHVLPGSRIGERCNIGQNVVIGPDVTIGNGCKIQNNVSVYKGVTLEDGVFCGPSMVFTNVYNPRAEITKMDQLRPILVKNGASLGANCTIMCGITIGRYAFVGAGAVVLKDVPDYALVVGSPSRQVGWMCKCGERLNDNLECGLCSKAYKKGETGLKELEI